MSKPRATRIAASALLGASPLLLPATAAAGPTARPSPITVTAAARVAPPNLQGTVALPARLSLYAAGWERARRAATGDPRLSALIAPARGLPRAQQIAFVQSAVHRRIHWISDATEYGRRDYWASAAETLTRGRGDMEDRAILKMEALKNLGVPARDLFLTVGTDKVAGPVTVLIIRDGGRYVMLDDTGAAPLAVDSRPDFEPMLTLGHGGSWLHGRRRSAPQLAAKRAPQGTVAADAPASEHGTVRR